uniref:Coiled-coil domain-containing protein 151 n=1 Tax=Timema cristinae TaxID=61476 RepID=A0A7R9CRM5_TIMCR|nr:unnamed protein product [Timema cristinae]
MPLKEKIIEHDLASTNKQIFEIKKKIQLSEGQRKAYFEECDLEKNKNTEKLRNLKKEIKQLYSQLGSFSKLDEDVFKVTKRPTKDIMALKNKTGDEVVTVLDCKVIDMQKKLDLVRHQSKLCQMRMKQLADEYHKLLQKNIQKQTVRKTQTPETRQVTSLENQIHHVDMNMMEAEHVKKKYRAIRNSLLDDSVSFESSLKKLEKSIQKQEMEIKHLQKINKEALDLRDTTRNMLSKQEMNALNAGKARDHQLQDFRLVLLSSTVAADCVKPNRYRVEERRQELERLERRIFPTGRPMLHHDSISSANGSRPGTEQATRLTDDLESAFMMLKEATGETETEQVLQRFILQRQTQTRLSYLKNITEEEKMELEKRKEYMMADLEAFKFAEVKDKEQNVEEMERLKQEIEDEKKRKTTIDTIIHKITEQLCEIRIILYSFCKKLQEIDATPLPPESTDISTIHEVVEFLESKIRSALDCIGADFEGLLPPLKVLAEDAWMFPSAFLHKATEQRPSGILPTSETDDEDDVPTRGFLKRQAQIIVDAKSRRKQFPHMIRSRLRR